MAVFEVLTEVVGAEELLRLVALSKLMHVVEVFGAKIPPRRVGKFFATVTTDICTIASHGLVEGCFCTSKCSAGPGVASQVKGVLVAFCFILVFEAVGAVSTAILLFGLVQPGQ